MPVADPQERDGLCVSRLLEAFWHPVERAFSYVRIEQTSFTILCSPASAAVSTGCPSYPSCPHTVEGLQALPGIGESMARAIRDTLAHGRLAMLERLRGESDPVKLLASVPGIGRTLADQLHHDLGIDTLPDLEAAAHDGRLDQILGLGPKRLAGIRDSLAHRLARVRPPEPLVDHDDLPSIDEILGVDREYREKAAAGRLVTIAPRRFNPQRLAWLPILHTERGSLREQHLRVGKGGDKARQEVEAKYESEKNQTTIEVHQPKELKAVKAGLVLLRLGTSNGALTIEY